MANVMCFTFNIERNSGKFDIVFAATKAFFFFWARKRKMPQKTVISEVYTALRKNLPAVAILSMDAVT